VKLVSLAVSSDHGAKARIASIAAKVFLAAGYALLGWVGPSQAGGVVAQLAIYAGFLLLGLSLVYSSKPRVEAPGTITLADDSVIMQTATREVVLRRRDITSAWVVRDRGFGAASAWVEMRARNGTTHRVIMDEVSADTLVDVLGFGPRGRVVAIELGATSRRYIHVFIGYVALFLGQGLAGELVRGVWTNIAAVAFIAAVYFALRRLVRAPIVRIGTDGIEIVTGARRHRVLRDDVVRFHIPRERGPIVIERRNRKKLRVRRIVLDAARVSAALDTANRRFGTGDTPERAAVFERGDRDVAAWRAHLRGVVDGGYRSAGATLEDAERIVVDPSATVEQRIGAALALRVSGAPVAAVRVAAEGAVDPDVRSAFDAIGSEEGDGRLEEALGRMATRVK
jgi:hypothetical protein